MSASVYNSPALIKPRFMNATPVSANMLVVVVVVVVHMLTFSGYTYYHLNLSISNSAPMPIFS